MNAAVGYGQYNFTNFGEGYGVTDARDVDELNKALEAGAGYSGAPTALTGGGALQVESLDASLKSVTYEMKNVKFWPIIAKDQAYNTIEQYNRIDKYGDQGRGFISEGSLPRSEDSSYSRQIQRVRFIGVTRELTHVYTLVRNAHGDAIAREIRNGTMRILEIVERALYNGRGHYSNSGKFDGADAAILDADLEWEGLDKQIRKGDTDSSAQAGAFVGYGVSESVVRDSRGDVLDEDALEDDARIVSENFGVPNLMLLDTKSHSDLGRLFYPKERVNPMGVQNGQAGFVLTQFMSSAGAFDLVSDVFLRPRRGPVASATGAPSQPSAPSLSVNAPTVADSKWSSDEAGDYTYAVTAINDAGESPISTAPSASTVAANGSIDVSITGVTGAFAYGVYRSPKGSTTVSDFEFIGLVAPSSVGGAATLNDLNHKLPGLAQSYLLSNDAEVLRFKQLAPLMKMDLAIIATAYRWMQLLYGTPIVYAPRKCLIRENIGRSA